MSWNKHKHISAKNVVTFLQIHLITIRFRLGSVVNWKTYSNRIKSSWSLPISARTPSRISSKTVTMARLCQKKAEIVLVVEEIVFEIIFMLTMLLNRRRDRSRFRVSDVQRLVRYRMVDRIPQQLEHLNELTQLSDVDCFNNLRMKRDTFNRFCYLLRHSGGLVDGRYVSVGEQVAIFLSVLSHHSKVRVVKFCFKRSSHTVHQHFHNVLRAVLNLHGSLLASPTPVDDECTHSRWKHFKGCLGALDGTLIDVTVPEIDKARYRTRKGTISVNILAVCNRSMRFVYMLTGWEGSVADARVLRDAVCRNDGFTVPHGLMDAGTADQTNAPLRNRNEKGRRGCSLREEQVLSDAMKRIVSEGWKTENGFRTGYLNLLHTYVKKVLTNTDLKPEPHINSRITVWKKNYHSIFEMLKHTGVSLDSTTYMVDATDKQWDAFMKRDPNARHMRHKSWPLYADWCEIFGQSRAIGGSFRVNAENVGESETAVGDSQTGEGDQETGKTASSCQKRKQSSTSDPFVDVVNNFCNTASDRLGEIAQRIGYDQDMSTARKTIYSSVSKMDTLTRQEKLRVTALIARHAEDIDVFFSLPDDDREEWVRMLLNGDI
ncbi:hypothetical protein ACS0TY_013486 [Phlomoides rotata]